MKQPIDDNQVRRYLSAFADGELDVEQSLQVLERMAMDPQTTRRVLHQQQLRRRVAQAMSRPDLQTPEKLRQQIMAAAQQTPAQEGDAIAPVSRSRWTLVRRWFPTAIAAVLLLTALLVVQFDGGGAQPPYSNLAANSEQAYPPSVVHLATTNRFSNRHVRCSRDIKAMFNTDRFPRQVTTLPGAIEDLLGHKFSGPPLDLSVFGYEYRQAGECFVPGSQSVHVLYRATAATGRSDSLSLWITANRDHLSLEPGRLYTAADDDRPQPLLIWRHNGLTYYLMGDSSPHAREVAQAMASR